MPRACGGFSLIEALISVLVLSIGLLGLGQLQARLYLASRQDAERMYASLISSELYEKSASYALSTLIDRLPAEARRRGPSTLYHITTQETQPAQTLQTRITLNWTISGSRAETVTSSLFDRSNRPFDTRWLLAHPYTLPHR